ncbi:Zn-dependent protease [Flavimobilis soli]|uniref:Zn-dependent protease n=1 Tax=Flavimobilis soli TaxID=442709 RepID=A0A2A9EAA9_9MICO|nr:site-2 protease family protein [Flavimobilis soli]PFG35753.1 Zn-dependent protease [Flavimobilis soli]
MGSRHPQGVVVASLSATPVVVAPSWVVGAAVVAFLYAPTARANLALLPSLAADTGSLSRLVVVVCAAMVVVLFGSVLLHELAHAWTARRSGHRVDVVVLSVWGGHTSFEARDATPRSHLVVAASGPATNLVLAGALWLGYLALDGPVTGVPHLVTLLLLYSGAWANLLVGAFNLLPSLPLDGGMILESAVWWATGRRHAGTRVAAFLGRALAIVVVLQLVLRPFVEGRGGPDPVLAILAVIIAMTLWRGADAGVASAQRAERVLRLRASDFVRPAVAAPVSATVAAALAVVEREEVDGVVLVDPAGRAVAYATGEALRAVPAELHDLEALTAATTLAPAPTVDVALEGAELFAAVRAASVAPVMVATRGRVVVGTVHVPDVVAALERR